MPIRKSDKWVEICNKVVEKNDKKIKNSDKRIKESDKVLEMNLNWKMKFGEKVVEVTTAIEAETGIEEENVKTIDIYDDVIPNMHVKRQKKPVALLQSPRVNEYDSTSRTKKSIVKDIFTFPDGVSPTMARYIDAFEAQYKKGLIRKNK